MTKHQEMPSDEELLAMASEQTGEDFSRYRVQAIFSETIVIFDESEIATKAAESIEDGEAAFSAVHDALDEFKRPYRTPRGYLGLELQPKEGPEDSTRSDLRGVIVLIKKGV